MATRTMSIARLTRLEEVARLRLRGSSERGIAAELGISQPQVHRDLKLIESRWIEDSAELIGKAKGRELARLELVIAEAWEAWDKSKEPHVRTVEEAGQVTKTTTTFTAGNVRCLEVIVTAIAGMCRILGVGTTTELSVTVRRYVETSARELGISAEQLQREIDEVAASAWDSWSPPGD